VPLKRQAEKLVRKGASFGRDPQASRTVTNGDEGWGCRPGAGGEESRQVFEAAMKTVDATFQNLDSSEISLTDVSHYFDSDPTKLVAGLRPDGKMPNAYIADTTTANAQVHQPPHLRAP